MSKPIPDHIMAKAREAVSEALGGKNSLDEFSTPIALAILAAVEEEREATLDAANDYMSMQYGNSALGHPVDRVRITSAIRARKGD